MVQVGRGTQLQAGCGGANTLFLSLDGTSRHAFADPHCEQPDVQIKIIDTQLTQFVDADAHLDREGQDAEVAGIAPAVWEQPVALLGAR